MSKAQGQRPCKLLWMLWFDEKSISNVHIMMHKTIPGNPTAHIDSAEETHDRVPIPQVWVENETT